MTRTARRAVGVVACALALAATTAAPAHAETQTHQDPRNDVADMVPPLRAAAAPDGKRVVDIVRVTNAYAGDTLTLKVRTTNQPPKNFSVEWSVRVGADTYYYFKYGPAVGELGSSNGCEDLTGDADRSRATVVLRVPSSCVGDADAVRVMTRAVRPIRDGLQRVDDAWQDGYTQSGGFRLGPRLSRD